MGTPQQTGCAANLAPMMARDSARPALRPGPVRRYVPIGGTTFACGAAPFADRFGELDHVCAAECRRGPVIKVRCPYIRRLIPNPNNDTVMIRELRNPCAVLAILFTLMFGAACADTTMPVESRTTPEVHGAGVIGDYLLPPITVTVPQCDPWTDLNWCEESGGRGDCMNSSAPGLEMSISSCPIEGGGGGGWGGTGTGDGTIETGTDPGTGFAGPAAEGPLLWGACVLAVLGSAYSIDQVAGAFESWWAAQREYQSARRMLDAIQANPGSATPEMISLWEFRVEYARNRRDDAMEEVGNLVNASYWTMAGAAAACGAAAFMPTP